MSSIGRAFERESSSVFSIISPTGGIRPPDRKRGTVSLRLSEREKISRGLSMKRRRGAFQCMLSRPRHSRSGLAGSHRNKGNRVTRKLRRLFRGRSPPLISRRRQILRTCDQRDHCKHYRSPIHSCDSFFFSSRMGSFPWRRTAEAAIRIAASALHYFICVTVSLPLTRSATNSIS